MVKSNNHENVRLAKAKGVWSTPPQNEIRFNKAIAVSIIISPQQPFLHKVLRIVYNLGLHIFCRIFSRQLSVLLHLLVTCRVLFMFFEFPLATFQIESY